MIIIVSLIVFLCFAFSLTKYGFIYRNTTILFSLGILFTVATFFTHRLVETGNIDTINVINGNYLYFSKEEFKTLISLVFGSVSAVFITSSLLIRLQSANKSDKKNLIKKENIGNYIKKIYQILKPIYPILIF